jgi:hypothetical protein
MPMIEHGAADPDAPVMVAQPDFKPEPAAYEPEPAVAAPKPRRRKAPTTGDTLEAPKPATPRKPRAKAQS